MRVPENSEISNYEYGLEEESSKSGESEEEKEELPEEPKKEEKKAKEKKTEPVKKPSKLKKESLECHGFNVQQLGAYPGIMPEGSIPNHLLAEKLDGKLELLGIICDDMKRIFDKGKLFPTMKQT